MTKPSTFSDVTRSLRLAKRGSPILLLGVIALAACGSSHEDTRTDLQSISGAVGAGIYTIVDSRSFAIDGGFYYWSGLTTEEVYALNDGPDQQWQLTASGSGFTICNVGVANACLSDGGGKLQVGVGRDVFTVSSSGSGYTIQSQRTGSFITDPASPSNGAAVPTSSSATAWTLNAQGGGGGGGGGGGFSAGTYYVEDPASFVLDGGFYYWSKSTVAQIYSLNDGVDQQWQFSASGSGFTICNVGVANACLSDGGSTLAIGVGKDTWTVASSGSKYTLQNQRTGRYIVDPSSPGDAVAVPVGSSGSAWTLASVGGSCTPQCSGLACGGDGCGGSCGTCGSGETCSSGKCVASGGSVTVNQNDACAIYSIGNGGAVVDWFTGYGSMFLDGDEAYTNFPNASVSVNFNGTGIVWTGEKGPNFGISSYAIDGASPQFFDGYSTANTNQVNVSISGLAPGSHVLQIQTTGAKNGASSDYYQTTDSFTIQGSALPPSAGVIGSYKQVSLGGSGWTCGSGNDGDLSGGHCWSGNAGDSVTWTFTGSLIEMYGRPDLGDGYFNVLIDGTQVATVDAWLPSVTADNDGLTAYMEFAAKLSRGGTHTIELVVTGTHNPGAKGENSGANNLLQFDEFIAFP